MSYKRRVLPGSVDLFIAGCAEAAAASQSGSAVECLQHRLQQRTPAADTDFVAQSIVAQPPSVEVNVWLYEQLRVLLCELNTLLAALSSHCTAAVCPVMLATADWEFLCAAHGSKPLKVAPYKATPRAALTEATARTNCCVAVVVSCVQCSAMAYMCHTLTSFAVLLSDAELFPSRSSVSDKAAAVFPSVCRRLYRIFAHAAHHHTAQFEAWEAQYRTCSRFVALLDCFQLMDAQQRTPTITVNSNSAASQ